MRTLTPISVCWHVTSACNLDCPFCHRVVKRRTLPADRWPLVVKALQDGHVTRVAVTGGEPMLLPGLFGLLSLLRTTGFAVSLITNGKLLSRRSLQRLTHLLDELVVSLDGFDPPSHAAIRAVPVREFERLVALLRYAHVLGLRTRVNTVITRNTPAETVGLYARLISIGVSEWRLLQFIPLNRAEAVQRQFKLTRATFRRFLALAQTRCNGTSLTVTAGDSTSTSGAYFSIAPDGEVFVSRNGHYIRLGHILRDSIASLASDPRFDYSRHARQYVTVRR